MSIISCCSTAVRNIFLFDNSTKGSRCCISLATQHFNIVDSYIYVKIKRERVVVFPWQQCLRERATVQRCTYIVSLVFFSKFYIPVELNPNFNKIFRGMNPDAKRQPYQLSAAATNAVLTHVTDVNVSILNVTGFFSKGLVLWRKVWYYLLLSQPS
jgi:hypothetical protein